MAAPISHALVLPDRDFEAWLAAARPYTRAFERVAVVRSPAGNDLNRFRNVSAVQAPGVWISNDALGHIRRAYPSVVRVDLIDADTPSQLTAALQPRIGNQDRYGERQTVPKHIYDRFILDFPLTDARPATITRPYADKSSPLPEKHEGFDLASYPGAKVFCGAAGRVTLVLTINDDFYYGAYVQVTSTLEGETFVTTYAGLRNIAVQVNQQITPGTIIGETSGSALKIILQNPPNGLNEFKLPHVMNPILAIYWQGLRLRPTTNGLRVRSRPDENTGEVVGTIGTADLIETAEVAGRTLSKVGVPGQWVNIRYPGAARAYVAAWLVEAIGQDDPIGAISGVALPGMNLDIDHPLGKPAANAINGLGWVRFNLNVSFNPNFPQGDSRRHGNTDVNLTFNRYQNELRRYADAGFKIILVLTHQAYGEGQGFVWEQMNESRWAELRRGYVDLVKRVVERFRGTNLVHAYQIWNEQDTTREEGYRAAVGMDAKEYGRMLAQVIPAIRGVDPSIRIIGGGLKTGPENAVAYAKNAFAELPRGVALDGAAFHPYGRAGEGFSSIYVGVNGTIRQAMNVYRTALPGKPVWITEWGILGVEGGNLNNRQVDEAASAYARGFLGDLRKYFAGQVACACWYAWADSMDNGLGLVRQNNTPRQPLYDTLLK